MTRPGWIEEEDQFLVDHINIGWSYLAIANAISKARGGVWPITRNAVAGRKLRLLKAGRSMKKPDHISNVTHANKRRAAVKARKEKVVTKKINAPAPRMEPVRTRDRATGRITPEKPGVLPMTENPKTILQLGRRQCRAAVGEGPKKHDGINNPFLFCGARTEEGETYCEDHAGLMYTKPKPRTPGGLILGRIGTNKGAA